MIHIGVALYTAAWVLRGILGFRPAMSVLEVVVWAAYVGITTWLFLRPSRHKSAPASAPETSVTA